MVGNFLAIHRGTKGISEKVMEWLEIEEGQIIQSVSTRKHPFSRAVDILLTLIKYRPTRVIVDTYSDLAFNITVIVVLVKFLLRYEVVAIIRGGKFDIYYRKNKSFSHLILKNIDELRTPSNNIKRFIESKGLDIKYFPNPIKLDNFPFSSVIKGNHSILWVRGFKNIYNPLMAIQVLEIILESYPFARLTMIGPDGGLRRLVENYVISKGIIDKVAIIGPVRNEELYHYMHSHEVFINTTHYESFGMAVVEAAAAGIPIVSTCVGELPLIWENGEEILMTPNNTAEEMADQIKILFRDKNLVTKLKGKARKKAELFDWQIVRDEWLNLLNSTL